MPKLKGYPVPSGYKGQLPDGTWQVFDTEGEYINYILEKEEEDDENGDHSGRRGYE